MVAKEGDPMSLAHDPGRTEDGAASHLLPPGSPCPNCGAALMGEWCHACGQKAEDLQRSLRHLASEALEGLTHFDSRAWRTLPGLLADPAGLTNDFLAGRRVSQLPPFRLYLIVVVIVFFSWSLNHELRHQQYKLVKGDMQSVRALAGEPIPAPKPIVGGSPVSRWLNARADYAVAHPDAFFAAIGHWAHWFAVLMLPIAGLLLTAIFALRRGTYVFDHLIFAMHSLSFQGLLLSVAFLASVATPLAAWLLFLAPAHLFVHMRGVYRTSAVGTLLRMAVLFLGSAVAFGGLLSALFLVGMAEAR
jgi:hypothetical protein